MLLSRYGNIDYVNKLSWEDGIGLINKAFEKQDEQRDWEMWVSIYPQMDKKSFVPFGKFRSKKHFAPNIVKNKAMTKDEILEKAEEVRKLHQGKHEGVRKE